MNAEVIRASEMALVDVIDKLPDNEVIHIGSDTGFSLSGSKRNITGTSTRYHRIICKWLIKN